MSTQVLRTDTFEAWRQKANTIAKNLGEVASIDSRISYRTLTHKGAAAYSVGNTLTGSVTGATATVTAVNGVNLVVTPVSGTFVGADTIKSRIYFDGAGTITAGSTITSTQSGATAKIFSYDSGDNSAVVYDITGAFSVGNTISGTSKTISNISLDTVSDIGENITNGTTVRELNTYSASAVAGINELQAEVGTIASLSGFSATNLVAVANEIKNSAITFNGAKTFAENVNLATTKQFTINGTSVLSSTTLGSGVVNSSLTSVGTIGTGTWQGSIVSPTYGGTGINNGSRTLTISTGNLTLQTAVGGSSLLLPSDGTVATLAGIETLTSKTINLASNTLTGTLTQFNAALSDDDFAALAATQTLTNKTIALGSNNVSGTLAQFNTALTDDDFVAINATQTILNKTLSTSSVWQGNVINSTYGGTGVNNGGRTLTINTGNVVVTAPAGGSTLTLPGTGTVATLAGIETLTNKTVNLASNTLTGTFAEFNAALTGEDFVGVAAIQTLSNKSVSLTTNTLTGTLAEFNTALTDDDFVAINATQTISNKTFVTPVLGAATASSINKVAITPVATGATLTIANGKTLTVSNTLTFTGNDVGTVAFGSGGTVVYTSNNITSLSTFSSADLAGRLTDETGSGLVVFNTSPSLTTPTIGSGGANFSGTSGTTNLKAATAAGTTTITMPAATGTMALTSDIGNGTLTLSTGAGIVSSSASFSANQSGAASYSIAHAVPSGATAATLGTNGISSITTDQFGHITAVTTATYLTAASGVTSIAGTANQVFINTLNNTTAASGAITLLLPQPIGQTSEPTFGGATLGNITVGVSTDNTITTSSGNLILTAAGTSTVNLSRPLVANTNLTNANKATLFSVNNSSAGAGADFPYNPTQSTRFSIDSTGNVTINGDLTVAGTTYLPTISGTVAWSTQVTGKTYFGSITDGTTAATPGDGTAFKIRTKDGLTAVVTKRADDATHGDNVLFGVGSTLSLNGTHATTPGKLTFTPASVATAFGNITITVPVVNGTLITSGDTGTVTTGLIADGNVTIAKLATSSLTVSAGTGLGGGGSVALGGSVTLTNAGVLSVNSQTGAVTIAGGTAISVTQASGTVTITNAGVTSAASGTGISISGTGVGPYTGAITITNSDKGSDQAIFKNIAVTGQTTVSAASNTATLNLVGSNITITTDNTTKTVTLTGNAAANNGTITVSAGTGMSGGGSFTVNQSGNSTVTLTNSDPGSSQFIFKNVAVPGQTTIVADTNNDTLTVQAGQVDSTTGIVITTDATTDTLTIAHANTSGQASVDNANGTVIQDITLDTYGHITGIASVDLDARYDARYTLAQVTTAGNTTTNAITVGGLTVNGNVTVNGTTTSVNTTTANLKDPIITLGGADNGGNATSDDAKDRGIEFRWHNGAASKTGFFGWDRSAQKFLFIPDATNTSEVFSGTKGTIDANLEWADVLSKPSPVVTVQLQGDVSGQANATLSSLGNGTITINTTINADAVTLGTDTVGFYVGSVSAGSYILNLGAAGEGTSHIINVDATSGNTASKVVARDGSGGFSAGAVTVTGLTVSKTAPGVSPGKATISFPNTSPGNDPGYIEHEESTSNTGIMRFCVGDDNDTNDYFAFGNSAAGSFAERFKITANGIVTTGTWNGSSISRSYTDAKIVSVASSGGSITVTDSSGAINVDLPVQGGYSGPASGCSFTVNSRGIVTAVSSTLAGAVVDSVGLSFQSFSNSSRVWTIMHAGDPSGLVDLYLPTSSGTIALTSQLPTVNNPSITVQGTDGLTGSGTFALNQSSAQTVSLSLPNIVTANTWNNVTVNAKGLVTGGTNVSYLTSNPNLQTVCNVGNTTSTSITAGSFIKSGAASTDILKGDGSHEADSNYVKTSGNQTIGGVKTITSQPTFSDGLEIQNFGLVTGIFMRSGSNPGTLRLQIIYASSAANIIAGTNNALYLCAGGSNANGMRVATTGDVTAQQSVRVTTALNVGSGTALDTFGADGEIRAKDNITAYYTSDERLKTNVRKIENALDKVNQIDGVIYDWNDEYKKDHGGIDGYFVRNDNSGVIAQQVEKVFPNVVANKENGMKAVRYELLVPLLIEAIKDLKAEIESLKANK